MKSIDDTRFEYTNLNEHEVRIDVYKNDKFTGSVKCYVMSDRLAKKLLEK